LVRARGKGASPLVRVNQATVSLNPQERYAVAFQQS